MKLIKKIRKKLNNRGSSIIMVVVALGFIAIIVAALLSAAGYAYKLKLQNKNATSNFYYVEQAMQEIYAGVGSNTINELKEAYQYTVENMVYYDMVEGEYKTLSNESAQAVFKNKFMELMKGSAYFAKGADELADILESYISNETVDLDNGALSYNIGVDKIVINDIKLTRIQEYKNSNASGVYSQTISADLVITQPDFSIAFDNVVSNYPSVFDYAMVADMGVEISQDKSVPLNIVGNIYAGNDYYNKSYNSGLTQVNTTNPAVAVSGTKISSKSNAEISYDFVPVSSKDPDSQLYNGYVYLDTDDYDSATKTYGVAHSADGKLLVYDGENQRSTYSGFYVSGSTVSIMADRIVVPGSIAVMDKGKLNVIGNGRTKDFTEIWADSIILDGKSTRKYSEANQPKKAFEGSSAFFRANMFVRDDTELNAAGSAFTLWGSYYGFGNGSSKDSRVFGEKVDENNFKFLGEGGKLWNRGHYNSSSIVLNGEDTKLDFTETNTIFLAGRAFIELSKDVDIVDTKNDVTKTTTRTDSFVYRPQNKEKTSYIRDYKTAESISVRSNQLMYDVGALGTVAKGTVKTEIIEYDCVNLLSSPATLELFKPYFPTEIFSGNILCKTTVVDGRPYSFVDFDTAYDIMYAAYNRFPTTSDYRIAAERCIFDSDTDRLLTKEQFNISFTEAYYELLTDGVTDDMRKNEKKSIEAYNKKVQENADKYGLKNIIVYDDFSTKDILLNDAESNKAIEDGTAVDNIYSSGAITTKSNHVFTIITRDDQAINTNKISALLDGNTSYTAANAGNLSKDIETKYNYIKWNLDHFKSTDTDEQAFIAGVYSTFGEDDVTPINKYFNISEISANSMNLQGKQVGGNKVWVSSSTVTITGDTDISGIIITKGDVVFADDVNNFQGMIIAGGKIYITNKLQTLSASPATCKSIIRECITSSDEDCKNILKLFKNIDGTEASETDASGKSIEAIDPSDVLSFENWMKNLGGDYDAAKKTELGQ